MARKIFISYRRDDSRYQARMIYHAFERVQGRESVFMDVDSIPPGANFRKILKDWVDECEVLLALIGPGWIDATDATTGQRRLDNPNDFVRIEIAEALARRIPVVPVLLDGTAMPGPARLPADLQELPDRQAEPIEFRTFDADVARLIRRLGLEGASVGVRTPAQQKSSVSYRADGRIKVDAKLINGASDGWLLPGAGKIEWFKDHEHGAEMVVVPAGSFMMGSPESEPEREHYYTGSESPQYLVTIAQPFAVGRHAVTRGQFAAFVNATGHKSEGGAYLWAGDKWELDPNRSWRNPGFSQTHDHPVVCVNWEDAKAYAAWLAQVTGAHYRLLSEAQWEYSCRAGTKTPFWWGTSVTPAQANYAGEHVYKGGGNKGEFRKATLPASSLAANPWGLYQMHGNVWEHCEDVWHDTYHGAPADGTPWLLGGDTNRRVQRGGGWNEAPTCVRSANRAHGGALNRGIALGFRVGRMLTPDRVPAGGVRAAVMA